MKILHLSSEYPPQRVFGLGRFVYDLAGAQAAAGHEVCVVTNSLSGARHEVVERGVRVCRVGHPPPPKPADESATVMQFNVQVLERACPIVEGWRPDAVNVHDWLTAAAGKVLKNIYGLCLVMTVHDTVVGKSFGRLDNEKKFVGRVEEWVCRRSDRVIANSAWVKRELVEVYGAPPEKVDVVPCAVDPEAFRTDTKPEHRADFRSVLAGPDEPVVLYTGRLDREKGLEVLMNALPAVLSRCPKVKFVLAGRGRLRESLEEHLRRNGLSDRVFFAGYVRPPALALLYGAADVQVVPSTYEPFGIVALEGMASGKPVLASKTGGLADIVEHRRTGLLVEPGSHQELAGALVELLADPELRERLGKAGRERAVEAFNWGRVARLTGEVYRKAIEKPLAGRARPVRRPAPCPESGRPRVLFDCQQIAEETTGIGRYAEELLGALLGLETGLEWVLLCHAGNAGLVERISGGHGDVRRIVLREPVSPDWRVQQDMLSGLIPSEGIDLYFPPGFLSVPRELCPTISVVHDTTYRSLAKELFPAGFPEYMDACVAETCRNAARIVTVSENSRREIAALYGFGPERIDAVPLAAGRRFFRDHSQDVDQVRRKHRLPERYVLMVNVGSPKKNFPFLLRAWARLPEALRKDVKLVGAGSWPPEVDLPGLVREAGLGEDIVLTGFFPDEDLCALYAGAELFCFPSLHEGFGLPVLEAMAAGVPVVASNSSSLPEVAGDAAVLLGARNEPAWAAAVERLLLSPDERSELAARGRKRAAGFSWEAAARGTLESIRKVLGPDPGPASVTLGILLGPGERERVPAFLEGFRGWAGDVVVVDDTTEDGGAELLVRGLEEVAGCGPERVTVVRRALGGDFGAARNAIHEAARGDWVLHADLDERWPPEFLAELPGLTARLEAGGKLACGFARENRLDGVLINDLPDSRWTEEGLELARGKESRPPRNRDVQVRLVRKSVRWRGTVHESPAVPAVAAAALPDCWVKHEKSLRRQRKQDGFYRSLGQEGGMPQPGPRREPSNLRERVLNEVMERMPPGLLIAVETGTLRDASPRARDTDGWSTYCLAELLAERGVPGSRLYSIDLDPEAIKTSRRAVPEPLHPWVTWVCASSVKTLESFEADGIDLLYLDSADDPELILREFLAAEPWLVGHSLVVVDDTGPQAAGPLGKGSALVPELEGRGWLVEHRGEGASRMTVLFNPALAGMRRVAECLREHDGEHAWLFGKGPSLEGFDFSAAGSLRVCVNESALAVPEPTYFFAHDEGAIASVAASWPAGCRAVLQPVRATHAIRCGIRPEAVFTYHQRHRQPDVLDLTPEKLAARGVLYAHSGTVHSALHFCRLAGVKRVTFVGFDGSSGYAPSLGLRDAGRNHAAIRRGSIRLAEHLGLEFDFHGER